MGAGQAAQTAKRSPEFSATYAAIAKRRGKKIATIAIARKLLTRAYHLLAAAQAAQEPDTAVTAITAGTATTHTETGRVTKPRARSPSGMSRPPAALDHLTEQPGPRTHGHGARLLARRRMGACETTPPAHAGDSTRPFTSQTGKGLFLAPR